MSRKQSRRASFYARQRELRKYPVSEVIHSRTPEGGHRMEISAPRAQRRLELMAREKGWRSESCWTPLSPSLTLGLDDLVCVAWWAEQGGQ